MIVLLYYVFTKAYLNEWIRSIVDHKYNVSRYTKKTRKFEIHWHIGKLTYETERQKRMN